MSAEQTHHDEKEDLFDFDALDGGSSKPSGSAPLPKPAPAKPEATSAATPSAAPSFGLATPEPALPGKPGAKAPEAARPTSDAAAAALARTRAILGGVRQGAGSVRPAVETVRPGAVELAAGPRDATPAAAIATDAGTAKRPIGQIALIMIAIANLVLAGVVWRSQGGADAASGPGADPNAAHAPAHEAPGIAPGRSATDPAPSNAVRTSLPLDAGLPADRLRTALTGEGETALQAAEEEIRRGEFERARARLYSLLSVIDRFDAAQRAGLASRAQVLAADSYRAQADALERQSAGFVPAASAASAANPEHPEVHR